MRCPIELTIAPTKNCHNVRDFSKGKGKNRYMAPVIKKKPNVKNILSSNLMNNKTKLIKHNPPNPMIVTPFSLSSQPK